MPPSPHAPDLRAAAPDFARGINLILRPLAALILRALALLPSHIHATTLWGRVLRTIGRVDRAMANIAAGKTYRPRPPRLAQPGKPRPATGPRRPYGPRGFGWLGRTIGYHARGYASQLDHLLAQPDSAALLAAAPHLARTLRPICTLLGIRPATLGAPTPRRPRPTAAPKPPRPQEPRPARRPGRPELERILAYPNIHDRPMRLLPRAKNRA